MKIKIFRNILISIFIFSLAPLSFAENTCIDCAKRKLNMCSEECALVPTNRNQDCQKLCITQYCKHKCESASGESEISSLFNLGCEECKEQQYELCSSKCDLKSQYKKALCQIDCTIKRCDEKCK